MADDLADGLPRNLAAGVARSMRLFAELQGGKDIVDAIAERRCALDELLAGVDAVHVLGVLIASEAAMDPETYSESETLGSAYVVELAAAALIARPARAPGGAGVLDGRIAHEVRELPTHRGRWLEQTAADRLADVLKPKSDIRGARIVDSAGQEIGEIDAILQLDDTVICVEAKSAAMRPSARRGGDALRKFLAENLTKAVEQSVRARAAVLDGRLVDARGNSIVLSPHVREVHTIAVTLDDLLSVAPVVWQLEGTELLPAARDAPWVVTLHELDQVCATVEWPAQLVLLLRRRERLNELGRHLASDELDWWMHFLERGLYFENESAVERTRFASLTDPLDAWMMFEHGLRETPAPKPRMALDERSRAALDRLDQRRPRGWVAAGLALMSGSSEAMCKVWDQVDERRALSAERDNVQRVRFEFLDEPDPSVLVFVVVPADARAELGARAAEACRERQIESPTLNVTVFGLLSDSAVPVVVRTARPGARS